MFCVAKKILIQPYLPAWFVDSIECFIGVIAILLTKIGTVE